MDSGTLFGSFAERSTRAVSMASRATRDGGVVTFLGIVRNRSDDGRAVVGLSYEAYEAPAVREFETIAGEARERFGEVRLAIVHAVGELDVGAVAVAVARRGGASRRGFRRVPLRDRRAQTARADLEEGAIRRRRGALEEQ